MRMLPIDNEFKVIVVGDAGVGKTCMLTAFTGNEFMGTYVPTASCNIRRLDLTFKNKNLCLKLWDLPGADKYRTVSSAEYFNAKGAIIVYSMTDADSLEHVKGWSENIDSILPETASNSLQKVVVGLKADSSRVCVKKEDGERIAADLQCKHFTASRNFNEIFNHLICNMYTEANRLGSERESNNAYTPLLGNDEQLVYIDAEEEEGEKKPCCWCCL